MEFTRQLNGYKDTVKTLKGFLRKEKADKRKALTEKNKEKIARQHAEKKIATLEAAARKLEAAASERAEVTAVANAERIQSAQLAALEADVLRVGLSADRAAVLSADEQISSLRALGRSEKAYMASAAKAKKLLRAMEEEHRALAKRFADVAAGDLPPTPSPRPASRPRPRLRALAPTVPETTAYLHARTGVVSGTGAAAAVAARAAQLSPRGVTADRAERLAERGRAKRDAMARRVKKRNAELAASRAQAEAEEALATLRKDRAKIAREYGGTLKRRNRDRLKKLGLRRWRQCTDAMHLAVVAARGAADAACASAAFAEMHVRFVQTRVKRAAEKKAHEVATAARAAAAHETTRSGATLSPRSGAAKRALKQWQIARGAQRIALIACGAAQQHARRDADAALLATRASTLRIHVAAGRAARAARGAADAAIATTAIAVDAPARHEAAAAKKSAAEKLRHATAAWRTEANAMWEARATACDAARRAVVSARKSSTVAAQAASKVGLGRWKSREYKERRWRISGKALAAAKAAAKAAKRTARNVAALRGGGGSSARGTSRGSSRRQRKR